MTSLSGVNGSTAQQEETIIEEPQESPGQSLAIRKVLAVLIQAPRDGSVKGCSHNSEDAFAHEHLSSILHTVVPKWERGPHISA